MDASSVRCGTANPTQSNRQRCARELELCHWDPPVARVALLAEAPAISERSIVAAAKPFVRPELHARARAGVSSGGGRECGTGRSLRSRARMAGTAGRRSRRRIRCRRAPSDCDTTDRTGAGWSEGASKQTNKQANKQTKRRRTPNADGQTPVRRCTAARECRSRHLRTLRKRRSITASLT